MTIKIITDSTCDIPLPETRQMGIEMVPLSVNFGDETFVDKFTITNKEFYKKLQTSAVMQLRLQTPSSLLKFLTVTIMMI